MRQNYANMNKVHGIENTRKVIQLFTFSIENKE